MTVTFYIDILFLVNWMADAVLLLLVGRLLGRRIRLGRVSAAAALGGIWGCVYVILRWNIFTDSRGGVWNLLMGVMLLVLQLSQWILIPMLMIRTAYPSPDIRERLRGCFFLGGTAILMGGVIYAVWENTSIGRFWQLWMSGSTAEALSIWLLAAAMAGGFVAITCGMWYRNASCNRERIQEVTLYCRGRQQSILALWDSGNQLRDPFTGQPVHIVEESVARELLPERDYRYLMQYRREGNRKISVPGGFTDEQADADERRSTLAVRWIPCRSLGSAHTLLPVFSIEKIQLAEGYILWNVLVGVSEVPLSEDGSYRMLLHALTDRRNEEEPINGH